MRSLDFRLLFVTYGKILPNSVPYIDGNLDLSGMNISKIENLPRKINGNLILMDNKITKIENLPEYVGINQFSGMIDLIGNSINIFTIKNWKFDQIRFSYQNEIRIMDRFRYFEFVRKINKIQNIKRLSELF